ncbi:amidase [Aspergillus campestris IBT 28561]|uniref:amidase n=1 Tax=Aspergillus campestris (strain IBT 28561) TaxID=1392248 RepID=A0A2I1CXE0_ASPC2|nr:amidase [Aspergillus campestris IBT 28561]PKY02297.1 amidase [Aspergillus campestris IBT 28561]
MAITEDWQALVDQKLIDRASQIPPAWKLSSDLTELVRPDASISAFDLLRRTTLLSPRELEITETYSAEKLVGLLATRQITSLEVTTAFCKRAAIAQQLTNCLTEIFFEQAIERAKELDEYILKNGRPMGPFHGLPISLKDTFMIEGQAATLGFISFLRKPTATKNSSLVEMLLEGGAVLYVKTNVPQTLFTCESYNRLFGTTMNPHNLSLTAGGSSSGEGALVGIRGSILGVGSDIGGSIRVPSLCNGIYGFKPTTNRVPYGGQQELLRRGWPGILPAAGPHAQSASDLTFFVRSVLLSKPWLRDSTALAVPWREIPRKTRLTIGVFLNDPMFPVFPPIARALQAAVAKLKSAGHEVIIVTAPPLITGVNGATRSLMLDTNDTISKYLAESGEDPVECVRQLNPAALLNQDVYSLDDVWQFIAEREDYREDWGKVWRENQLDVLLCPASRGTAVPHDKYGAPVYTLIWNFLDFPASVIPYEHASKALDTAEMDGFDGAPCHVQIVGWQFQDEEVLSATETIAEVLNS